MVYYWLINGEFMVNAYSSGSLTVHEWEMKAYSLWLGVVSDG